MGPPLWGKQDGDIYWSLVKLLLHFDGNYLDSSSTATHATGADGATISGTEQKYGSGALDATASNDANAFVTNSSLAVGTGDFCIECWFNDRDVIGGNQILWLLESTSTGHVLRTYSPSYGGDLSADTTGGGPAGSQSYSFNTYHHVAVTRSGNNWTHWFDGASAQTWTNSTFNGGTGSSIWIGRGSSYGSGLRAFVDDFRLTVGVPRYTAPFTPAGPFPDGPA